MGDSTVPGPVGRSSQLTTVQSKGIYHGLPVYPPTIKGLTALVIGANGISGQAMVDALAENPTRWNKIYAMSRKKSSRLSSPTVKQLLVDLLEGPETIAKVLKENQVVADYVFFFAYAQPAPPAGQPLWSNSEEMADVNGKLLQNSLDALQLASNIPKRFVLQTGGKTYGMHLGPINIPWTESDPRVEHIDNNFYYRQEDSLKAFAKRHNSAFNIIIPSWILGATKDAAMNILYPLAVYAACQKHLGKPLSFPGDIVAWDKEQLESTAQMNSYFSEWVVLKPEARDESFNIVDDYRFNWGRFWPLLAGWFGLPWSPPSADEEYTEVEIPTNPRGYGPNGKLHFTFNLISWAQDPGNQKAWREVANEHGIKHDPFEDLERVWTPINFALISSWPNSISMDKARKLGWHGYLDTHQSIRRIFEQMVDLSMIPPFAEKPLASGSSE